MPTSLNAAMLIHVVHY